MRIRVLRGLGLISVVAFVGLIAGCTCRGSSNVRVGELRTESRSIDLDGVESVTVILSAGVGEVAVSGGARELADAEFEYNVEEWRPEIDYRRDGTRGVLTITQGGSSKCNIGSRAKSSWDLVLNSDVRLDLEIEMGAGDVRLNLAGLELRHLDVDAGFGNIVIDMTGDWTDDVAVNIDGGVGNIELRVPDSVGVRVERDVGIGSTETHGFTKRGGYFVNDAYGETDATLDINVDAGIGKIRIESVGRRSRQV